jgi:PKD repeat protein
VSGSYTLRLTVTDSSLTTSDDVIVSVAAANQAPVVNAGPDQSITLPAVANLAGTATDDGLPTGSTLTRTWSKVSGPGTVTFGNASSLNTTATFSVSGTYTLRLTVSDSSLSSSDDVIITVAVVQTCGSTVLGTHTLAATATDNVGVVGVQFKLDGANLGTELTTFPYSISWNTTSASNGCHTLSAVARDAAGNQGLTSLQVTVSNP